MDEKFFSGEDDVDASDINDDSDIVVPCCGMGIVWCPFDVIASFESVFALTIAAGSGEGCIAERKTCGDGWAWIVCLLRRPNGRSIVCWF